MSPQGVHMLMVYSFSLLLLMVLASMEACISSNTGENATASTYICILSWASCLVLCLSIYNYGLVSNQAYFKLHLMYEQGYAYSVSLIDRIQSLDGYEQGKTVALVGNPTTGARPVPPTKELDNMTGIMSDIPAMDSFQAYLKYYLGYNQKTEKMGEADLAERGMLNRVRSMPTYPNNGSVQIIDNLIIVKFSEVGQE
jgi:hypothetical protein